jgi:hypothetical protein
MTLVNSAMANLITEISLQCSDLSLQAGFAIAEFTKVIFVLVAKTSFPHVCNGFGRAVTTLFR